MPGEQRGAPTIRELVEDAGFEIELVAGARGADRECRAVYVGEHLDPIPWMTRSSLHLMAGIALRDAGPDDAGPRLIRLLHDAGMAGLGISMPHYLSELPLAMAAEADRLGLPLLAVTGRTLFRDIERYVFDALVSVEMQRLRRTVSIQQQLLEQLRGRDPVAAVLQRLAALLDAHVLLFGPAGQLVVECAPASAGGWDDRSAARLWMAYSAAAGGLVSTGFFTVESLAVSCREVCAGGAVRWILMAARPKGEATDEFVDTAVGYVQKLLEMDLELRRDLLREHAETGVTLLEDLITRSSSQADLAQRLARHGFGPTRPYRVLVVRPERMSAAVSPPAQAAGPGGGSSGEVCARVSAMMSGLGVSFLACPADDGAVVLATLHRGEELLDVRMLAHDVVAAAGDERRMVAGLSEECAGANAVASAYSQALLAVGALGARREGASDIALYDDLGPGRRCLEWLSDDHLRALRARVVEPLLAQPRGAAMLYDTLACYLRHDASVTDAAREMRVHRNTLCQRLSRIETILSLDLKSIEGLSGANLGVEAARVLEAKGRPSFAVAAAGTAPEPAGPASA
jgi:PucR family transcriptional regulator, purine catabolism regulatory protein